MSPTGLRIISFFGILAVLTSAADLVRIPFSELAAVEGGVTAKLQQALKKDGIIAIEGIPGFKQVRRNALTSASALASTDDEHVVARTLADGSVRSTLGTEFNAGAQRLSFSAKLGQANGDKISQLDTMQSSVDNVAAKLSAALDASVKPHSAFFGDQTFHASNGQDGESWDTFNDLMHGGSYLEHVHSYKADTQQNLDGSKALDYHTDAGLFILFTPALYANDAYDRQVKTPDFRFQDRDGKEHAIVVQTPTVNSATTTTTTTALVRQVDGVTVHTVAPDTMVLMVGQGAVQYLNPALVKNGDGGLRAVPHSLTMNTPGVRNWYGRMYLPPAQAWHAEQQTTHAAVRRLLVETTRTTQENTAVQDLALPIGCGLGHPYTAPAPAYSDAAATTESARSLRALPLTYRALEDCPTGTIYCWTMCLVVADYNLNCSYSDVTCVDSSGQPVDPNQHDSSNQPGCVDMAPTDPGGFCQGNGVNMYMSGFVSYVTGKYRTDGGSTTPQCLVLWFEDWELNGKGKFTAGCFGVFLLGIWTESLTSLRRQVRQRTRQLNAKLQTFVMSLLYAIQLMFGYFCMLVAMTYQVELFVCVVLGLGAGHGLFHFKAAEVLPDGRLSEAEKVLRAAADLDEVVDPCCQYLSMDDDSNHSTTQLAAKNGNNQPQAQQGANGLNGKNGGSARANPMH